MTSGFFNGDILRGLTVRILFFLSIALLPIGLIAVVQSRDIAEQIQASAELSLLAITERASSAERAAIQEAFGAAEALSSIVRLRRSQPEDCSSFLREYKQASDQFSLVGFIALNGQMSCSSTGKTLDFSSNPDFQDLLKKPKRRASPVEIGSISKMPVTLVNSPVYEGRELIGFMAISIPNRTINKAKEPDLPRAPVALMTVNTEGEILTAEQGSEKANAEYPTGILPALFSGKETHVFRASNSAGLMQAYAVVPVIPDAVYAISAWPADTPFLQSTLSTRLSALLPIAMWLASLIVALWALNRLAIKHIRKLGRQMRRFALNRTLPRASLGSSVPTELFEMEESFIAMAESILRDEATLEDSLRQKNILLKEVHHRVKNNLQLISSIMNMQIRQAKTDDARLVLRRLQERILSLATVHKNLYQNDDLVSVDAKSLLTETVDQLLSVGLMPGSNVRVVQDYEPIMLDADDAAPLTLLVSEAMTNALKYVYGTEESGAVIRINLVYDGPERARLIIENTTGAISVATGTGLGSRLIQAFTRQLNGEVKTEEDGPLYRLILEFPVPQRKKEVYDY